MSSKFGQYLIKRKIKGAGQATVTIEDLRMMEIPLPSFVEQKNIVNLLDKFDIYCNDIARGLSAEIKARQQQYE